MASKDNQEPELNDQSSIAVVTPAETPSDTTATVVAATNPTSRNSQPIDLPHRNQQPTSQQQQISIEQQLLKSKHDLESMVIKYARSERENLQNKNKVDELDKKLKRAIKDNDSLANRIKLLTNDKNHLTDTLNAKVAQLTVLEQKNNSLNSVQGVKLKECEEKIVSLEKSNEDLLKQIETYKNKEGELLDFSERLSMKHMLLQTELDKALEQQPDYKVQYEQLVQERDSLLKNQTRLEKELELLGEKFASVNEQNLSLSGQLTESQIKYRRNVEELENEIKLIRRKHQIAMRELQKQLKEMQVELEGANGTQIKTGKILTA